jgi:hypothetical protein
LRRRSGLLVVVGLAGVTVLSPGFADIEEQRARLPPPASCADPVAGVWMSKKHYPARNAWRAFTLTIERAAAGRLTGQITNHGWRGGPEVVDAPPCGPGGEEWTVAMSAAGAFEPGGLVHFYGTSWRLASTACGVGPKPGQYSLDHFSGTIDVAKQELHSLNTDGGNLREDPAVFRRVRCFDAPPAAAVVPPPPPAPRGGCGCGL